MDSERIAKLEEQGKWIAEKIDRMDLKLDRISEKVSTWIGRAMGVSAIVSLAAAILVEFIRK